MSVARMRKLKLIGLKKERDKIMNVLVRSHAFEVKKTCDYGVGDRDGKNTVDSLENAKGKQSKVGFAINFLDVVALDVQNILKKNAKDIKRDSSVGLIEIDYNAPKATLGRRIIGYDDFYDVAAKEFELLSVCEELQKISFERLEIKSKLTKLCATKNNLEPYKACPIKFSDIRDTTHTFMILASGALSADILQLESLELFVETYISEKNKLVLIIGGLKDKQKTLDILSKSQFSVCSLKNDFTAAQMLAENAEETKRLQSKAFSLFKDSIAYEKYLTDLKTLYDVLAQEIENSTAELEFVKTRDTFITEGWVPSDYADILIKQLNAKTDNFVYALTEPQEGDEPPTLLKNCKAIKPFEDITNMYSVPNYNELDPNPFMAVFFFIFFGIMIGDAGYGVILSIVCLVALKVLRLEKGMARLIALIGMGGISAIVWGVVFGGLFSIQGIKPLWFSPMEEPIKMLVFSLCLGALQLLVGYALLAVKHIRNHKPLDAILDTIFIYFLFAGIACIAINMFVKPTTNTLMICGISLLGCSLAGILLTSGRHKKGVFGKVIGGFAGLYGLVNILSDVLSYARLFGLALASGAIGYAFNILGGMFFAMPVPVLGYVLGIIILIPLHAFNLGIGLLGAYVHNARLQFLEFYGKFYDGGGLSFSPLGLNTRYVRFD